jgi:death-on-curing family protein
MAQPANPPAAGPQTTPETQAARQMHYLSVHDFVWINNTVTGKTLAFDYEKLEAAMAAQYSYGDSTHVAVQAANLLGSLLFDPPFEYGNRRTAYVALTTFLNANGHAVVVSDEEAARIVLAVAGRSTTPAQAIDALAHKADIGLRPGVTLRALVTHICNEHADALKALTAGDE